MAKKNRDEATAPETPKNEKLKKNAHQEQCDGQGVEDTKATGKEKDDNRPDETQQLKDELKEKEEQLLRLAAEYDNFRKRSSREKEEIYANSKVTVINEILPVIDNFERAAQNCDSGFEEYKKGIEMIFEQFTQILEKMGVETFGCVGDTFDPNMHSAVMHIDDESLEENSICEVFAKGYKLGEKVIRFAVVKVAN